MKTDFKSKNVKQIAVVIAICAMLLLTLAFYSQGIIGSFSTEKVEAVYGKAIFGGGFSWLGNVKRPGLSTSVNDGGLLAFDFKSSQSIADRFVNPTQGLEYISSFEGDLKSLGITANYSPFNREPGTPNLYIPEQARLMPLDFGGDGSSGDGYDPDPKPDPDPDPDPVVPAPGAISLALLGIAAVVSSRKKNK